MSKFLITIASIILIGVLGVFWGLRVQAQAQDKDVPFPKACLTLSGSQRDRCKSCIEVEKGAWIKVPIPVIVPADIPSPQSYIPVDPQGRVVAPLPDITANGHCIHNIAVLGYLLYYFALVLMAVVSLFILMLGGYQYLTALGSAQRTSDAKARIFAALAGLVLGLTSYLILQFINPDLVGSRYDEKLLKENLKKAMENLMNRDTLAQGICPKDTGEQQCREKKIGDLCTPSIAGQASLPGYCEEDANIVGCVCNQNDCAYFCADGSTTIADPKTCIGKQCYAGGVKGVCLTKTASPDKVECLDAKGMCENGQCGENTGTTNLDCRGFYACTGGYCLGGAAGVKTGSQICKSAADICQDSNCGRNYEGMPYVAEVNDLCAFKHKCNYLGSGSQYSPGACFAGGACVAYAGDNVNCQAGSYKNFACDLRVIPDFSNASQPIGICKADLDNKLFCVPVPTF